MLLAVHQTLMGAHQISIDLGQMVVGAGGSGLDVHARRSRTDPRPSNIDGQRAAAAATMTSALKTHAYRPGRVC